MILRRLLEFPELEIELVEGVSRLDRTVRWVYTTDLLEPARYLRGGELVLTSGLWYTSPAGCERFVGSLVSREVSGLVIGLAETGTMPTGLPEACVAHNLPLFTLPEHISFGSVSEAVIGELSSERDASLARSLGRHQRLLTLIATGRSVDCFVDFLAEELDVPSYVFSTSGRLLYSSGPELTANQRLQLCRAAMKTIRSPARVTPHGKGTHSAFRLTTIQSERTVSGYLVCAGDHSNWAPDVTETVEVMLNLIAIELADVEREQLRHARQAETFFRSALGTAPSKSELRAHLRLLDFDPDQPVRALAGTRLGSRTDPDDLVVFLLHALEELVPDPLVANIDGEALALLPGAASAVEITARLRDAAAYEDQYDRLAVGVSDEASEAAGLTELVAQAREAAAVAAARGERISVAVSADVDTHGVLLASTPERVRRAFHRRVLGPLLEYDRKHKSQLEQTLILLLEEGRASRQVADRLQVHINTLRYRLSRIEELTGKQFSASSDRADLLLALRCGQEAVAAVSPPRLVENDATLAT